MNKWDTRFLKLAAHVSDWSKDPSTKVGAVITRGRRVVSIGYNGFAQGVNDDEATYADRAVKLDLVIHAEKNAILFASQDLKGCTLYTWPFMTCSQCAAFVIQSGIKRVVAPFNNGVSKWTESFERAQRQYHEAGVAVDFALESICYKEV